MRKKIKVIGMITMNILSEISYCIDINLRYAVILVTMLTPYLMYYLGQKLYIQRGEAVIGGELFIPLLFAIFVYYLKELSNYNNKGNAIPVPERRFTTVDDDGEVTVNNDRLEEMILYMADLEDYLERKRLI